MTVLYSNILGRIGEINEELNGSSRMLSRLAVELYNYTNHAPCTTNHVPCTTKHFHALPSTNATTTHYHALSHTTMHRALQ